MEVIRLVEYSCDYCDKSESEVDFMVVGISDSVICDQCVSVCADIIAKRRNPPGDSAGLKEEAHGDE